MKNLFILGAGASRLAGGPLMSDFLDRSGELLRLRTERVVEAEDSFTDVFNAIAELRAVHEKSYLDLDNIEVLFGAIEMAQLIGKLGERNPEEIALLRDSIITLIYKTLESSISFPVVGGRRIHPPEPYENFVNMLKEAREGRRGDPHQYSFITFNYDLTLDYALSFSNFGFDYCLSNETPQKSSSYLKLHGSINWGVCNSCGEIVPNYFNAVRFDFLQDLECVHYDLGSKLSFQKHCDKPLNGPPVLVPPTWNKTGYHEQLSNVWKKAAVELSEAENIFVIGYSLPETDSFFRYLYALGSESATRIRRFWVFDPDLEGFVEQRFRTLIGRGIENRFIFKKVTFHAAVPIIRDALNKP